MNKFFKRFTANKRIYIPKKVLVGVLVIAFLSLYQINSFRAMVKSAVQFSNLVPQLEVLPTNPSINIPEASFAIPTEQPIIKPSPTPGPNPIVNCGPGQYSKQYVKDRLSNCKYYVDCGLSNNTVWTMMLKSECDKKHSVESGNSGTINNSPAPSNINKVPVFISFLGVTFYCLPQNVSAATSINSTLESKKTEWFNNFNNCANNLYQNDSCYLSCKSAMVNDINTCQSAYGLTGDNYNQCYKGAEDKNASCIKSCPDVNQKCDWTNSERRSLLSQLTDLCK